MYHYCFPFGIRLLSFRYIRLLSFRYQTVVLPLSDCCPSIIRLLSFCYQTVVLLLSDCCPSAMRLLSFRYQTVVPPWLQVKVTLSALRSSMEEFVPLEQLLPSDSSDDTLDLPMHINGRRTLFSVSIQYMSMQETHHNVSLEGTGWKTLQQNTVIHVLLAPL